MLKRLAAIALLLRALSTFSPTQKLSPRLTFWLALMSALDGMRCIYTLECCLTIKRLEAPGFCRPFLSITFSCKNVFYFYILPFIKCFMTRALYALHSSSFGLCSSSGQLTNGLGLMPRSKPAYDGEAIDPFKELLSTSIPLSVARIEGFVLSDVD